MFEGSPGREPTMAPRMVWGVAALVHAVGDALAARFGAVTVHGELTGWSRAGSGHCYFSLKDVEGGAVLLRCALFRRAAVLLDFLPADGHRVELRGRMAVYEPRGELQFIVESMRRRGDGSLYERFVRLKETLQAQGLFDTARKRPLPRHPARIGVVTSLDSAALHDVLTTLARRAPHVAVVLYPTLVQGHEAPAAIVAALGRAVLRREVDVLLLVRGGGSLEDLWAFNDERVVRAVAACGLPVVCGVGHETDVSLADFAADLRAPTPTAAAELAAPSVEALRADLRQVEARLRTGLRHLLDAHAQRLDRGAVRLSRPAETLRGQRHALRLLAHRLASAVRNLPALRLQRLHETGLRLQHGAAALQVRQQNRMLQAATRLDAVDPKTVTRRGYAWLEDAGGRPVRSAAALVPGQPIRAVLADGEVGATVTSVRPQAAPEPGG